MTLSLLQKYVHHNIIQHGSFTLNSGVLSPVYINIKGIYDHPQLFHNTVQCIQSKYKSLFKDASICGAYHMVPFHLLP